MILNYRIEEEDLTTALEEIDKFKEKMELFIIKYPKYNYVLNLDRDLNLSPKWIIDLKIKKDEHENNNRVTQD